MAWSEAQALIGLTQRQTFLSWLQQRWFSFSPDANPSRSHPSGITSVNLCTRIPDLILFSLTLVTCQFWSHTMGREWNYEFLCLSHWFHLESNWVFGSRWITKWKSWPVGDKEVDTGWQSKQQQQEQTNNNNEKANKQTGLVCSGHHSTISDWVAFLTKSIYFLTALEPRNPRSGTVNQVPDKGPLPGLKTPPSYCGLVEKKRTPVLWD